MERMTGASVQPVPVQYHTGGRGQPRDRGKAALERPGMMTDGEIVVELKTAAGDRLADLLRERAERREYRAAMRPPGAPS
jgi:hypothetical protein